MNKDQYSAVFQAIGLSPHVVNFKLISGTSQAGFSDSLVICVTTNNGTYSLRGWAPNALSLSRIKGLHRLLKHLAASGLKTIAVPLQLPILNLEPIDLQTPSSDSTRSTHPIRHESLTLFQHLDRYWQLEPWLPGHANFNENPNAKKLTSMMHELAKWHLAAANFQPTDQEKRWFDSRSNETSPAVIERRAILAEWSTRKAFQLKQAIQPENQLSLKWKELAGLWLTQFETQSTQIENELTAALSWLVPLQPCLRDVWNDHILFSDDQVTGIIDPSATRMESVAADLSRLLGSLVLETPASWQLALSEYEAVQPLTINERRLIPVLHRSGVLLGGLSWLDRICLKNEAIQQEDRVYARVQHLYSLSQTFS